MCLRRQRRQEARDYRFPAEGHLSGLSSGHQCLRIQGGAQYLPFGFAALDALDAGNELAAQAMAGSLIDTLVNGYFGKDRINYTPSRKGTRTTSAYDDFTVREFIAMAPIWQAYQQFDPNAGDLIPTTFSRHATAHTVNKRQYMRRNAVQGLMLACSLIYFFNEQA